MQQRLAYYLMAAKLNCYFLKVDLLVLLPQVNGENVHIFDNAVHLGHNISTSDRDSIILEAKRAFWKGYSI